MKINYNILAKFVKNVTGIFAITLFLIGCKKDKATNDVTVITFMWLR